MEQEEEVAFINNLFFVEGVWVMSDSDYSSNFPPCLGCGFCCISMPCFRSAAMGWAANKKQVCERLFFDKGRYWCQEIIDNPDKMITVGVGAGCPSVLCNDWRKDVKRRD